MHLDKISQNLLEKIANPSLSLNISLPTINLESYYIPNKLSNVGSTSIWLPTLSI